MSEFVKKRIRKSKYDDLTGKRFGRLTVISEPLKINGEAVIAREKGEKIYHNQILEGAT